jgi:hypothetical protein
MRYFFHLRSGNALTFDPEGAEFPNIAAALREARLAARELLADAILTGKKQVPESLVITDRSGRELGILPLEAVLPLSLNK